MTQTLVPGAGATPLRVLVVDDSTLMRKVIAGIVACGPDLALAGEARDGLDALAAAERLRPDVILLDIEMPRMNGLEFLAAARLRSVAAVIVISSVVQPGSPQCLRALELGARDVLAKPSGTLSLDLAARRRQALLDAIRHCRKTVYASHGVTA